MPTIKRLVVELMGERCCTKPLYTMFLRYKPERLELTCVHCGAVVVSDIAYLDLAHKYLTKEISKDAKETA